MVAKGLTVMLEFRHDWSPGSRPYVPEDNDRPKVQDTVTASVMVEF